jgi:glycosyltransferase involved in cell wall biosynthesis
MRVICFIENLVSGGAERQLVQLAIGLSKRGHDVEVLVYHDADHFRPCLEEKQIPVHLVAWRNRWHRIWAIHRALKTKRPDVVIAFKKRPALYAELSHLFCGTYQLIVSERNYDYRGLSIGAYVRLAFHALADAVVANSKSQFELIKDNAFWLKSKVVWISNAVDLGRFRPKQRAPGSATPRCRLLVLARFAEQKNPLRFVQAIALLRERRPDLEITVDWYGSNYMADGAPTRLSSTYLAVKAEVAKHQLQSVFNIHEPTHDVALLLHDCDVLCLPSLYEGFSNVVGEAIACGTPVLASNVSDNPLMVHDGVNGYLFDPTDPGDIADAIIRFCACGPEERLMMGTRSREIAEVMLSQETFVERYERLLDGKKAPH